MKEAKPDGTGATGGFQVEFAAYAPDKIIGEGDAR